MTVNIEQKIRTIASKDLTLISFFRLWNVLNNLDHNDMIWYIKIFVKDYYKLSEEMSKEFYESLHYYFRTNQYLSLFQILSNRNIYALISYLKYNNEPVDYIGGEITPLQYYQTSKKQINHLVEVLKLLPEEKIESRLSVILKEELQWQLKRIPHYAEEEYVLLAYKLLLSIGLDNSLELIGGKYGEIDYRKIFYLFQEIDVTKSRTEEEKQLFISFLFGNKKSPDNIARQMLDGSLKELFLNFDYFYNEFRMFLNKLGSKLPKDKVVFLLKERYLSQDVINPNISGDIFIDMLSSYYNRYDLLDTPEDEVHKKNLEIYNEFLRGKHKSSIPMISITSDSYFCETIKLSDPRNLVLGYRAGNCFRFNGDASILFRNFLKSEYMRLVSISTPEYKDFAMMLVMRNGNVLIGQGIEVSKWAPSEIKGKKLYEACKLLLKEMMDYMNNQGDDIVATIIGSSNTNVSNYNSQILPFLINPILENSGNYYNGIYNYQCLLDLREGASLNDISLYIPQSRYLDERDQILRRERNTYDNYREIEKRLISLRFFRTRKENIFEFYQRLAEHREILTCCNTDWYITLFDDETIDGFIHSTDDRAQIEYEQELEKIEQYLKGKKRHNNKRFFFIKNK